MPLRILAASAATLPRVLPSASMRYHFLSIDCGLMKIVFINSTFIISTLKNHPLPIWSKALSQDASVGFLTGKGKVTESFGSFLAWKFPGKGRFMKIALRLLHQLGFQRISSLIRSCESVRFHARNCILSKNAFPCKDIFSHFVLDIRASAASRMLL